MSNKFYIVSHRFFIMAKFAFLGSSYIATFERFCSSDMKIPDILRLFGVSDICADNVPYSNIRDMKHFCPDVVYSTWRE